MFKCFIVFVAVSTYFVGYLTIFDLLLQIILQILFTICFHINMFERLLCLLLKNIQAIKIMQFLGVDDDRTGEKKVLRHLRRIVCNVKSYAMHDIVQR